MILSSISSFRTTYGNLQKYGWNYNQTVMMYNELTETVVLSTRSVSVVSELVASFFLAMFGAIFLFNNSVIKNSIILESTLVGEDEQTGITFPLGEPEDWDLGIDLKTRVIQVMLNGVEIDFPLTKILGWVEKHEKKKMEDAK